MGRSERNLLEAISFRFIVLPELQEHASSKKILLLSPIVDIRKFKTTSEGCQVVKLYQNSSSEAKERNVVTPCHTHSLPVNSLPRATCMAGLLYYPQEHKVICFQKPAVPGPSGQK